MTETEDIIQKVKDAIQDAYISISIEDVAIASETKRLDELVRLGEIASHGPVTAELSSDGVLTIYETIVAKSDVSVNVTIDVGEQS